MGLAISSAPWFQAAKDQSTYYAHATRPKPGPARGRGLNEVDRLLQ